MPHKELQRILKQKIPPHQTLNDLIFQSLKTGGKDNITGIVAYDI